MILKLMKDQGTGLSDPPDNPRRACKYVDNIVEIEVKTLGTGEQAVDVVYSQPNRGLMGETFILNAPAFLMNNSGKTIQLLLPADGVAPLNCP